MRTWKSFVHGLPFLLSLAVSAQPRPEIDLPPIVRKAVQSYMTLRYTGTRVLEFKVGPDKRRHTEYVIRDGGRSRIEFPQGSKFAGQVIVETGGKRYHYFPDLKEIRVQPARRDEAFGRIFKFMGRGGRRFKVSTAPGAVVAGIRTEQAVMSDQEGNVAERIHIDPRSGLILKLELFDETGLPVGGYEFSQVNLNPTIDQRALGPLFIRGAKMVSPRDLARRLALQGGFLAATIPDGSGWQLEHSRVFKVSGVPVFAQIYMGGPGRLSLFQVKEEIEPSRLRRMGRDRGPFNTYAWQYQGRHFVLVGEQDQTELQRLAGRLTER